MEIIDEEIRKLMEKEEIRKLTRSNFVLHTSPLEIVNDAVINNIDETELIIDVKYHYLISQYWCPRSSSSSSLGCQKHPEYLHLRDDHDDEEMILACCRPSLGDQRREIIILDSGVFAASDDDDHIMSTTLLNDADMLFEYFILPTYDHLVDLKRSIIRRISEAKAHILSVKPTRVRICVDVSHVSKRYFGSAEAATFIAAMNADTDASLSLYFSDDEYDTIKSTRPASKNVSWNDLGFKTTFIKPASTSEADQALQNKTTFDKEDIKLLVASLVASFKPASRLSKEALLIKTFEKEDLQFLDDAVAHPIGEGECSSSSSSSSSALISYKSSSIVVDQEQFSSASYSCPLCLKELVIGEDTIMKMPCSHVFHPRCLDDWLRTKNTCPLCPFELPFFRTRLRR